MNRGQITISWMLGIAASIAIAAVGTMTASGVRTDNKVGVVQKEVTEVSERVARLETSVPLFKEDIGIIRDDLRDIKKALNIK